VLNGRYVPSIGTPGTVYRVDPVDDADETYATPEAAALAAIEELTDEVARLEEELADREKRLQAWLTTPVTIGE